MCLLVVDSLRIIGMIPGEKGDREDKDRTIWNVSREHSNQLAGSRRWSRRDLIRVTKASRASRGRVTVKT